MSSDCEQLLDGQGAAVEHGRQESHHVADDRDQGKICRSTGLNRFSRNSGVVKTLDASRNGMKNQINSEKESTLPHSDMATQMP